MQPITDDILKKDSYFLYIHTPFCGTCHLAKTMLSQIESIRNEDVFYEMNASLHPEFMQIAQVESVPCLLIKRNNEIKEKIYAFHSIQNIFRYLIKYNPKKFLGR